MNQYLHFSIGPVQDFVAEARRTRDLWAGSFLLSWLIGQAMAAAKDLGGEIHIPDVENDALYKAILKAPGHQPDYQPSLTNHFVARFTKRAIKPGDVQKHIVARVHHKWCELAEAVWVRFVKPADFSNLPGQLYQTRKIWNRQIETEDKLAFWDILWVLGDDAEKQGQWLDQRKTWRAFETPEEEGDMCRMMGRYQELSGYIRSKSTPEREKQDIFWDQIRKHISETLWEATDDEIKLLELRESERLCAIAFVKRMFPRLHPEKLEEVVGWLPETHQEYVKSHGKSNRLHISYRPSTAFVAATHWIARTQWGETAKVNKLLNVIGNNRNVHHALALAEQHTNLPCHATCRELASMDGRLFYRSILQAVLHGKGRRKSKEPGVYEPEKLLGALKALTEARLPSVKRREKYGVDVDPPVVGDPSPYYAVLLMDGDRVGKLIAKAAEKITEPLARFAKCVSPIIQAHNGSLIYAGGDDLLALMPIEEVLCAAEEIRTTYEDYIGKVAGFGKEGTISAAIIFAHYEASLSGVLRRARLQLEKAAKQENGRASLALAIHRTDGAGPEWVSTWDWWPNPVEPSGNPAMLASDMQDLAVRGRSLVFASSEKVRSSTYGITSNAFVYGVHERLREFFVRDKNKLPSIDFPAFFRAVGGEGADEIIKEDYERLMRILRPQSRGSRRGMLVQEEQDATRLDLNGLLILRFLASEWRRIETE